MPMLRLAPAGLLLSLLLLASGCQKNIQTQEAVRAGLMEHLTKVSGLDTKAMKIDLGNVSFRENEADVTVTFVPNGADPSQGMQMSYTLERKGEAWVVKSKRGSGGAGSGAGGGAMPGHGGTATPVAPPTGAMPPGHPPVPGAEGKKP